MISGHVTAETLTEIPGISRHVPAKILMEQGAAAPMSAELVWSGSTEEGVLKCQQKWSGSY